MVFAPVTHQHRRNPDDETGSLNQSWLAAKMNGLADCRLLWVPDASDSESATSTTDLSRYRHTLEYFDGVGEAGAQAYSNMVKESLGSGIAVTFDGTNDCIRIPDHDALSFGDGAFDDGLTFVYLVNPTDFTSSTIIGKRNPNDEEYLVRGNGGDNLTMRLHEFDGSTYIGQRSNINVFLEGSWNLGVSIYDGSRVSGGIVHYLFNGTTKGAYALAVDESGTYPAMSNVTADVYIGREGTSVDNYWNGKMSNIAIYGAALDLDGQIWPMIKWMEEYYELTLV